ncbi:MAG: hypothetical protein RBU23_10730 [Candidatus Auribacterota bacterium]|nr:hypothetical protein [Candidatus Auribacterota bacterium]
MRKSENFKIKLILIISFVAITVTISGMMSWYKSLPRFHDLLGNLDKIEQPLFFESVFQFVDYSELIDKIQKNEPERQIKPEFAIREFKGTYWICDPHTEKAYTPVPGYNLLDHPSILRVLPSTSVGAMTFSSLRGLYRCKFFIREDPQSSGLTKIVTLYIKSFEKIGWQSIFDPAKKIDYKKPQPNIEEIRLWRSLINERYPPITAPVIPHDATRVILFHSVPQGIPVYAVKPEKIDECTIDGRIDMYLLRQKALTAEYSLDKTPFVLQYDSFFDMIVLYEFITTSKNILDDGQILEIVERMQDNPHFYRIVRGYPLTVGKKDRKPAMHTALFQLKDLTPDEIFYFIGQSNTFPIDEELLEVYIEPILRQARKEITHPDIDFNFCSTVLAHAGKLNIETSVGNYVMELRELTSFGYSVTPVGRSAKIVRQDNHTLYRLRDFIYRK